MTTIENFTCVFCSETFHDKELLQEHFRKHGDKDFDKNARSKIKTQYEVSTSTEKSEDSELVGCDVCEEMFPTISKAITHKHKVHPDHDAKYFCPWCGKLFTMKHLYNKHIQSTHKDEGNTDIKGFHCDCCGIDFYNPSAMLHHNKFFHRQDIDDHSLGSSKKVKLYNQEMVVILYCPFCGEEYNNKVNLHKHMEDDHSDENQSPEDVLRCPLCEAYFYHLDAYELHLTFHSTDDVYNEPNEMISEITEFSLDAVPPLMEKIQEANYNSIDSFLEVVQNEPTEYENKVKQKKHKKHKKSKKETITLDEFLNMNKDVFGDGLNVQGIEEVPTQMVLQRKFKGKKSDGQSAGDAKTVKQDLAKLKKQGIIVKAKSSQDLPKFKVLKNIPEVNNKIQEVCKDPNDVISKLMSQGNSQIKIVRKLVKKTDENKSESYQSNKIDSSSDYDTNNTADVEDNTYLENNNQEADENTIPAGVTEDKDNASENDKNINKFADIDDEKESKINITQEDSSTLKTIHNLGEAITIKSLSQINCNKNDNTETESPLNTENIENEVMNHDTFEENEPSISSENQTDGNTSQLSSLNEEIVVDPIAKNNAESPLFQRIESENKDIIKTPSDVPLQTLKGVSEHVTVKKVANSTCSSPSHSSEEVHNEEFDDENNMAQNSPCDESATSNNEETQKDVTNSNTSASKACHADLLKRLTSVTAKPISIKNSQSPNTGNIEKDVQTDIRKELEDPKPINSSLQSNTDILKRLKHVTAKPVSSKPINKPVAHIPKREPIKSVIENEVEVFHIDDSDSDADGDTAKNHEHKVTQPLQKVKKLPTKKPTTPPPLRSLNKNITVKSMSHTSSNYTEVQSNNGQTEIKKSSVNRSFQSKNVSITQSNRLLEEQKNLQKTISHLRRHVSIKPKNTPTVSHEPSHDDHDVDNIEQGFEDEEYDSDPGEKVKITELEDNKSDNDHQASDEPNIRVESPQSPHSSNKDMDENNFDDDFDDIEAQIKANPIKTNQNPPPPVQNPTLSKLSKELTIKPVRHNFAADSETKPTERTSDAPKNIKAVPLRPLNQRPQVNKNVMQSSQKASTSNQVNTVKTVKTYQSQTVIEEVTTTVTKTIRTVNTQVNNPSQTISRPTRPQKVITKPPNVVNSTRQAPLVVGAKIRNYSPVRPVRPSNTLVPMRPRLNSPQMPSPAIRKPGPVPNRPRLTPTRPMRLATPTAATVKRPSEETGHFSCFKKPKESLIPVQDIPSMTNNEEQYSSSQSKSTFSNVIKIVKGNAASTSQVKTETMRSQEKFAKLSGVSGLKIVKSSTKEATQVEKCETSSPVNNTMAALEKLQRQGLLIKKPRLDLTENENSHNSGEENSDNDY
ncbi:unnamed protein product [Leptosia nina]|uniref:C2H2-type domain-containing protein n=1 Tax=Leptosia nina TaxID=320188 RepID=A0AAV1JSK1_9NEOP